MFIDRERELDALDERYENKKSEFVVVYGRRRVGKSELIKHFIKNKNGVCLLAREEAKIMQLRGFSEKLSSFFNDEVLARNPFRDWDAFFTYIAEKSKNRIVLALDEFPYLVAEDRALPSIIQDYWDNKLKETGLFLILCGSSISMMEKKVLRHKSPLYGRRTGQILLKPFKFRDVCAFLKIGMREAMEFFSVFGGTPAYFTVIDKEKGLFENISKLVLRNDSFLYRDPEFLLREELKEPRYYFSVLHSVAKGNTKLGEIINDAGLERGIVAKYLSVLSDLYLVKREVPVTENPLKSRMGIYVLQDNFFRFWFRYIYPHKEEIETGKPGGIIKEINGTFSQHVSHIFEEICIEALLCLEGYDKIPAFAKIGRWWHKDKEIDIVALNGQTNEILFGECKWQDKVDARRVLADLKEKAKFVQWNNDKRKEHYAIFAKNFREKIRAPGLSLFDLKDMEMAFKK